MKINKIYWLLISILFVACVEEIDDLNFTPLTPEVAFPIGKFTLQADQLTKISDSLFVQEGDQGIIELYYEIEVLRSLLFDKLSIPNQSFNETIPFSSFVFVGGTVNEVKFSQYGSFTLNNSDLPSPAPTLEQVIFKAGSINIGQVKNFDHQLVTTITFPKLIQNGNAISIELTGNESESLSLISADLDLTGISGTESNTLDFEISTVVTNTGTDGSGIINYDFSLTDMEFSFVKGDLRSYQFDEINSDFDVGLPQDQVPDNIGFTNPQIEISTFNTSGIEFGLDINEVTVTEEDGSVVQITGTYNDATFLAAQASTPGETMRSDFFINKTNTDNLVPLLNNIPSSVFFSGAAGTNPNGTPPELNFVTDSSEILINARLILPLEGYVNDYAYKDTITANLEIDSDGVITLEKLALKLQVENSFPFSIGLQMYFLDSINDSIILDSLFLTKEDQRLFKAAQVDNTGLVVTPSIETNEISLDREKYERIKDAGSIAIVATILTPGANASPIESIKVSSTNYFTIGIGLFAEAYIDPNSIDN